MRIRNATPSDNDALDVLDQLAHGGASRREYLVNAVHAGHCSVAEKDGQPVGFIIFDQSFFEQTFIHLLMVHPHHRRQGVAKALMQFVERTSPTEKVFTSTNQSNIPMQKLCASLGYVPSGVVENLDEGDPELFFFKRATETEERPPS
jgi:GNAT superfamily N-acetyltransferase